MEQELIKKTIELFDDSNKWNSFLELSNLKEKIINQWSSRLIDEISIKLDTHNNIWEFKRLGNGGQWYLREFGETSLSIKWELEYFSLVVDPNLFDINLIFKKIREPEFRVIYDGFIYKDTIMQGPYIYREKGRFEFGSVYDNHFDWPRLAWFAGHKLDEYIKQIQFKLKPFFENSSTDLFIELNSSAKK